MWFLNQYRVCLGLPTQCLGTQVEGDVVRRALTSHIPLKKVEHIPSSPIWSLVPVPTDLVHRAYAGCCVWAISSSSSEMGAGEAVRGCFCRERRNLVGS